MNAARLRWPLIACTVAATTVLLSSCAVGDGGYDGSAGYYGADYYEPYGYDYGGWGVGYDVGPYYRGGGYRGGDYRGGGGRGGQHAYRSAPASHGVPSIPSGSRGGGHGGGGGGHR